MLHMKSLSAWRLKMFSPNPAAAALRMVLCCHNLPNFFSSSAAMVIGVSFRAHPSAAAPSFVAHAPVAHAKGLSSAVLDALLGERASRRHVAILDPVAHFLRSAAPNVAGKIRLRANHPAQADE